MKKILFLLLLPAVLLAEFQVIETTQVSVTLEYTMQGFSESVVTVKGRDYKLFLIEEASIDAPVGHPAIPTIYAKIAVPFGCTIQTHVSYLQTDTRTSSDLMPNSLLYIRGETREAARDEAVYSSGAAYPQEILEVSEPRNFRGATVAKLRLHPIQYFPQNHEIEIYKKLRIRFDFTGGQTVGAGRRFSRQEMDIFSNTILNHQQVSQFAAPANRRLRRTAVNYDFSTGRWFRIPIKNEGIYAVTGSQIKEKGVDLSSVPVDNIHVYNYGGFALPYNVNTARPGDLNEIAVRVEDNDQDGLLDENDRIIFYGKGMGGWYFNNTIGAFRWEYLGHPVLIKNGALTNPNGLYPYDDTNYYLLNFDNRPGKRIPFQDSPQLSNPELPQTFTDFFHFEEDHFNILSSGPDWYWIKFNGISQSRTVNFSLPQNIANGQTKMSFKFKGSSGSFYPNDYSFRYQFQGMMNDELIFDYFPSPSLSGNNSSTKFLTSTGLTGVKSGSNRLLINYKGNLDGCEAFLDYFEITLQRPFVAENNFLHFRNLIGNNQPWEYQISGLPGGSNWVWDISDFANVVQVTPIQNGQSVIFQDVSGDPKPGEYFVFSPAVIQQVSTLEVLENHPNLRDASRKAEFLIITPDEFYDAAAFLENMRETQIPYSLETERVKISEIFEEFSSSVRDVTAIRDFLKYAYENWSDTLKFVLLFGDGHYDYRGIQLAQHPNYVPPFEIEDKGEVDSRESDNFYVAFDMDGDISDIDPFLPIGRLPMDQLDQIAVYRDKLEKYIQSYLVDPDRNGWQTHVTLVSDDQFGGRNSSNELSWHLTPTEDIDRLYIPEKFNRTKIYLHDYKQIAGGLGRWKPKATEDLINQINRGTLLISYFGHGSTDTWAHESVMNRSRDLPVIHNRYRLPLWVAATCTWGKSDDPNKTSMAEELTRLPERGGIAVIAAARPVFVYSNTVLAKNFYRYLFRNKSEILPSRRLGEAFYLSLLSSANYQKYHLYGDPTMHLADPQMVARITQITPDTLKALATVNVQGRIENDGGTPVTNFNGYAVMQVFDAVDSMYTDINNINLHYQYPGGTIFKGLVSVNQGQLDGNFIVPKSIKYKNDFTGRISLYAWSENGQDAAGFVDTLLFFGTQDGGEDQTGPGIEVAFKDFPNFFDGDFIGNQPTLIMDISDENGINLTGEVGHGIELTIDGALKKNVTDFFVYRTDSYREGKLEYTLPALSTGSHSITISCWDNLNNYSEKTLNFRSGALNKLQIFDVVNFPNPFSEDTYFTFQLVSPSGPADIKVTIYTVTGRKIQEISYIADHGFNKIYWDGRDWDGDRIANGVYLYKIVADDGSNNFEVIEKLAIVR